MSLVLAVMLASGTMQFSGTILPAPESEIAFCRENTSQPAFVCECAAEPITKRVTRFNIGLIDSIRDEEYAVCRDAAADVKVVDNKK